MTYVGFKFCPHAEESTRWILTPLILHCLISEVMNLEFVKYIMNQFMTGAVKHQLWVVWSFANEL